MKNIWIYRGERAGELCTVSDEEAEKLINSKVAQNADDGTPWRYPENHPHYGKDVPPEPRRVRKSKKVIE